MAISPQKEFPMSSSNLAVRMDHTASDLLSHPPRPCFVSSRMRTRQRFAVSVPARLSRTGSSSFAIRVCGTSAYVDPLAPSSAIDRICDDARMRRPRLTSDSRTGSTNTELIVERLVAQAHLRAWHFPFPDDGHPVDAGRRERLAELEREIAVGESRASRAAAP